MTWNLYADGGCIGRNEAGGGSRIGGTWAYRAVRDDGVTQMGTYGARVLPGIIKDWDHPELSPIVGLWTYGERVSNNHMEMWAVLMGLRGLADINPKEGIHIYSDSQITLGRLFHGWAWNGMPIRVRELVERFMGKLIIKDHTLLKGHPTAEDLERGYGTRPSGRTYPVHARQQDCDIDCNKAAQVVLNHIKNVERWPGLPKLEVAAP